MVRQGTQPLNDYLRIFEALNDAVERLGKVSDSPRLDAELLLARALEVQRSYLFAHPEDEIDPAAAIRFESALKNRINGMPMAYIAGEKEFWSMPLVVSPATLIPRPDTELLVEQVLIRIPQRAKWKIADLGTGSGAIALAIAKERRLCHVTATDISEDALSVACENARLLALPNIEFSAGDWTTPIAGSVFDLVVSNPPYVATRDPHLAALQFEPTLALDAGKDGLDAIRRLAESVPDILRPGGSLLLEHGFEQAPIVSDILRRSGWCNIALVNDLEGRPRVTAANRSHDRYTSYSS